MSKKTVKSVADLDKYSLLIYNKLNSANPQVAKFYLSRAQLWNYIAVGVTGTVVQWLWFTFMRPFLLFEFFAFVISVLIAYVWTYYLNKKWVFRQPDEPRLIFTEPQKVICHAVCPRHGVKCESDHVDFLEWHSHSSEGVLCTWKGE